MLSLPTVASAILALSFPLSGLAAPMLANNELTAKDDHSQVDKVNQAIKNLADDLNDTTDNLNKIIITALSNSRNDDKRQSIKNIAQSILKDEHDADQQRAILISVTTGNLHSRQSQSNSQQIPGQKNNVQPQPSQPSQQAQPKNNNQNSQSQQNQNNQPSKQGQTTQQNQDEQKKKDQQAQEDQKKKQQQQDAQNQQNQKNNENNNNNKPSNSAPTVVVPQVIKPTVIVAPPTTNNDHSTTTNNNNNKNNNDHSMSTTTSQDTILNRIQSIINNPDPETSFNTAIAIGLDRNAHGLITDHQLIIAALIATGQVGVYDDFHTSDTVSTWHL